MKQDKKTILLQTDKKIFHTDDLALLWSIQNRNTLKVSIRRFLSSGVLFLIKKGFYSTIDPKKLDPVLLGSLYLRRYTYLSTESVLAGEGLILQSLEKITLISGVVRNFTLLDRDYKVRKMKKDRLHNSAGIESTGEGYLKASVIRAVSDMWYYNPNYYIDGLDDSLKDQVDKFNQENSL